MVPRLWEVGAAGYPRALVGERGVVFGDSDLLDLEERASLVVTRSGDLKAWETIYRAGAGDTVLVDGGSVRLMDGKTWVVDEEDVAGCVFYRVEVVE